MYVCVRKYAQILFNYTHFTCDASLHRLNIKCPFNIVPHRRGEAKAPCSMQSCLLIFGFTSIPHTYLLDNSWLEGGTRTPIVCVLWHLGNFISITTTTAITSITTWSVVNIKKINRKCREYAECPDLLKFIVVREHGAMAQMIALTAK